MIEDNEILNNSTIDAISNKWYDFLKSYKIRTEHNVSGTESQTVQQEDLYIYTDQIALMPGISPVVTGGEMGTVIFYFDLHDLQESMKTHPDDTKTLQALEHQVIHQYAHAVECIKRAALRLLEERHHDYSEYIKNDIIVCVRGLDDPMPFAEIAAKALNRLIRLDGMVVNYDEDPQVTIEKTVWMCDQGHKTMVNGPDRPKTCYSGDCSGKIESEIEEERVALDFMHLTIQERDIDMSNSQTPPAVTCRFEGGELIKRIKAAISEGRSASIHGILKLTRIREKGKQSRFIFHGSSFELAEDTEHLTDTDKQIDELVSQEISWDAIDSHYDKCWASICIHLQGLDLEKEATWLLAVGADPFKDEGGTRIRGELQELFFGDPASGKSDLLKFSANVRPHSMYAEGKLASAVGLTAGIKRDEFTGVNRVSIGVYLLVRDGIACIDEVDKLKDEDRMALSHVTDDSQTVSLNKADINREFKTRCASLHAANPNRNQGYYDSQESLINQTNIDGYGLSRYDLVWIMRSKQTDADRKMMWKQQERRLEHVKFEKDAKAASVLDLIQTDGSTFSPRHLLREADFLRKNYHPFPPQPGSPAFTLMQEFWDALNKMNFIRPDPDHDPQAPNADRIHIPILDRRKINTLIRLSCASARAHRREEVLAEDMQVAIKLMRAAIMRMMPEEDTEKISRASTKVAEEAYTIVNKHLTMEHRKGIAEFKLGMLKLMRFLHKVTWENCRDRCEEGKIPRKPGEEAGQQLICSGCNGDGGAYVRFNIKEMADLFSRDKEFRRTDVEQYFRALAKSDIIQRIGSTGVHYKARVKLTDPSLFKDINTMVMQIDTRGGE